MISTSQSAQFKAANPHTSVWVSASAGTGKTRVLVNRILRLLLDGNAPEKLLCITYTKSAAAEILERISEEAAKWATSDDDTLQKSLTALLERSPSKEERFLSRTLLPKILQAPGGMRIMTIHAFCQSVLSRFSLEAGINGNFQICDDQQSHDLLNKAKQNLLLRTTPETDTELFDALTFLYDRIGEETQDSLINTVVKKRHKLEILSKEFKTFSEYKNHICQLLLLDPAIKVSELNDGLLKSIPVNSLDGYADILLSCKTATPQKTGQRLKDFISNPSAELYCKVFLTQNDTILSLLFSGIDKTQTALIDFLEGESQRTFAYKEKLCALDLMLCSTSLYLCCYSLLEEYKNLKQAANLLDYEDQILLTEKLLTELSDCEWVLYKLDASIDHLLLDEAQDTSPSQWAIVDKLVDEFFQTPGNGQSLIRTVFVVGDEKQSIFSFQNADPALFSQMKDLFKKKALVMQHPYEDLSLIENYRSSSIVLDYVDVIFKDEKLKNSISHTDQSIKHEAFFKDYPGQIDIWPLVPKVQEPSFTTSEHILAGQVGQNVEQLLTDKSVLPGHIMILVRKRHPMVNPLVKAFKDRNIPVRSIDRLLLSDQLVVQDCLTALGICLNPLDDYNLSCFLKSPFIDLSEEELFEIAHKREGSLWDSFSQNEKYQDIITYYHSLLDAAQENTPYNFFHTVLSNPCPADQRSGKHALITRLGYDVEDILDHFLNTVLTYQQNNTFSNQGIITWLLNSDATTKSQMMSSDDTHVRIMTVHASKGLQAPIVFLVDAHSKPEGYKSTQDVLWREADNAFLWAMKPGSAHPLFTDEKNAYLKETFDEYYRLFYVALTRAKERLIICGCEQAKSSHKEYQSWHEIAAQSLDALPYPKDGSSAYKRSTQTEEKTVSSKEKEIFVIPDYLMDKPPAEPFPHFPLRPSQLPGKKQPVFSPLSKNQTSNFVRGEILHKLFSAASRYSKEEQPAILHRILENYTSDTKQVAEFYNEVWSILSDKRFADLFSSKSRAEVPITGQIMLEGTIYNVNGQIDRLLIEDDRVLIVDFKTNRPASKTEADVSDHYKFQLTAYKMILQKIYPEKKIETAILWTSVPYLLPLSL